MPPKRSRSGHSQHSSKEDVVAHDGMEVKGNVTREERYIGATQQTPAIPIGTGRASTLRGNPVVHHQQRASVGAGGLDCGATRIHRGDNGVDGTRVGVLQPVYDAWNVWNGAHAEVPVEIPGQGIEPHATLGVS